MPESPSHATTRILRGVIVASLGVSLVLASVVAIRFPSPVSLAILAAVVGATSLAWLLAGRPSERRAAAILILASVNILAAWPELSLRLVDFRHESGVEFGFPARIDFTRFTPDPDLFWTYPRGRPEVNSFGFRDREGAIPKPPGVTRLVFLGDSCTDLGEPVNYPTLVKRWSNADLAPDRQVESVVMAVSGYSSHQGRIVAERYGPVLEADAAVVYFGWNDHWWARNEPDALKRSGSPPAWPGRAAIWLAGRSRSFQALQRLADRLAARGQHTPQEVVRVPLEDYRANLTAIAAVFAGTETPVLFITAPTTWYRYGASQRHIDDGYVPDAATAVERHRTYNAVVRQVAAATGSALLDLEQVFDTASNLRALMMSDGIHFTEAGLHAVAEHVLATLQNHGIFLARGQR